MLLSPWVHQVHSALLGAQDGQWPFDDVWLFCECGSDAPVVTTKSMVFFFEMRRLTGANILALRVPRGTSFKYFLTGRVALPAGIPCGAMRTEVFLRLWPWSESKCKGSAVNPARDPIRTTLHITDRARLDLDVIGARWMLAFHDELVRRGARSIKAVADDVNTAIAMHRYKLGEWYFDINRVLFDGPHVLRPTALRTVQETLHTYTRLFGMQKWDFKGAYLFRCVYGPYSKYVAGHGIGQEFTVSGIVSTSFDPEHALWFGDVMMVITPRPGMQYLYLDGLRDAYCGHGRRDERWVAHREVLLPPATTFRVTAKESGLMMPKSDTRPSNRYMFNKLTVLHVDVV